MNQLKQIVLLFTLILFFYNTVRAQKLNYGIIVGTNASFMYMKNVPKEITYNAMYAPSLNFNTNAFISYRSKGFWGLSLEPGLIKKGGIQLFDYMNNYHQNIHYKVIDDFYSIELPILFDIYLNKKLYISTGLEFEYRFTEKATMTDLVTWNDQSYFVTKNLGSHVYANDILPDDKNRFSYSGLVGLHYDISRRFDLGIRYGIGLKELIPVEWLNELGYSLGNSNVYNNYLQLILKVKL